MDHPQYKDLILISHSSETTLEAQTDLVITLGGDGTILHTSNLFGAGECPPVLSFSMGSLGFLLPFRESLNQLCSNVVYVLVEDSSRTPREWYGIGTRCHYTRSVFNVPEADGRYRFYGTSPADGSDRSRVRVEPDATCVHD